MQYLGRAAGWRLFGACMLLVLAAAQLMYLALRQEAEQALRRQTDALAEVLRGRLQQQEQVLAGVAVWLDVAGRVNRGQWAAYVASLKPGQHEPALRGLGYGALIRQEELPAHEAAQRRQGYAHYAVHPRGMQAEVVPMVHLAPFGGSSPAALGYDLLSDPALHRALRRAGASGQAALSGATRAFQPTSADEPAAVLMAMPVYRKGLPQTTEAQRWTALTGFVYAIYDVRELLGGVVGSGSALPEFTVYDGDRAEATAVLFDSGGDGTRAGRATRIEEIRSLAFYGQRWSVSTRSGTGTEVVWRSAPMLLLLGMGTLLSVLLLLVTNRHAARRAQSEANVAQMVAAAAQREQAAQESAQFLKSLLDNAVDGIITIDERGLVQQFNRAAERIFLYAAEEVIGRNVKMLMPEPYRSEHDMYIHNYRRTGVAKIVGIGREVVGRRSDGSTFPMELGVSVSQRNAQPQFVGFVRDISERKRVERLKGEFVSTVSHELRTPLTSIGGALGLLSGGGIGEMSEKAKTMVDIAYKNSQRLTVLINDLLDMEKLAADKMRFDMEVQPLMPLIEQAIESTRAYAEKHRVSLELLERLDGVQVRVDGGRLQQVLGNLLSNASKFSPEGAQVQVAVRRVGGNVRVEVIDQGPGIAPEFRSRIFEKFSQADSSDTRQRGGTGLGLAISKELVERMGGLIGFESEFGGGATFHFVLPLIEANLQTPELGTSARLQGGRRSILVVEDDPDVAQLMQHMLSRADYAADTVPTAGLALELLTQRHYDALTLDLLLPDQSGIALLKRLRSMPEFEHLPVIVVSAFVDDGKLAIRGQFEGTQWLQKPIGEGDLLQAVSRQLRVNGRGRVLHVEDDADLAQVLAALGSSFADFEAATSLAEAREKLTESHYDVVLLDVGLPDGSGLSLIADIEAQQPKPKIIVLSGQEVTPQEMRGAQLAMRKGRLSNEDLLANLRQLIDKAGK